MPGRFANLEFEQDEPARERRQAPAARRGTDALDVLAAAHEENHWGRYESALRLYTRCLQQDRRVIAAWVGQVQMLVELREYHEARMWSDKSLELFRDNGELLAARAQACVRLHDLPGGYRSSDAALAAPGSSPWRWIVRGELLLADRRRQWEQCLERGFAEPLAGWFDRVIAARVLRFHGRAAVAIRYLREALELDMAQAHAWYELGLCYAAAGSKTAAADSYARCLALAEDFTPAQDSLDALQSISPWRRVRRWLGGWRTGA